MEMINYANEQMGVWNRLIYQILKLFSNVVSTKEQLAFLNIGKTLDDY